MLMLMGSDQVLILQCRGLLPAAGAFTTDLAKQCHPVVSPGSRRKQDSIPDICLPCIQGNIVLYYKLEMTHISKELSGNPMPSHGEGLEVVSVMDMQERLTMPVFSCKRPVHAAVP